MKLPVFTTRLSVLFTVFLAGTTFAQLPVPDIFSPTFSHHSGRYNSSMVIQLATKTPSASIYYTLNGSDPDSTSQLYSGGISITGNGTYHTLKTITQSHDGKTSAISAANYLLDYAFNPNSPYLTNLTWTQYNSLLPGNWFGRASTPWTIDYNVSLTILSNGNYIDSTTSGCGAYPFNDIFDPVFYYGKQGPSPLKVISLYNILASGYANGFVTIDFGYNSTNQDELRFIKFIDNDNLYLEMWHASQYGPLKYHLTRQNTGIPTGLEAAQINRSGTYPNPASDHLIIQGLNSAVLFIDQLGRIVTIEQGERLNVSHLQRGFYTILYRNTGDVLIREKLVLE